MEQLQDAGLREKRFPLNDSTGFIELRWVAPEKDPELEIVNAAKVSHYNASNEIGEREAKLLSFLEENKHISPSYHPHLSFRVKCPIFVAREWFRHTVGGSFNEISQRYLALGQKYPLEFYIPDKFRTQAKHNRQASEGHVQEELAAQNAYQYLLQQAAQTYEYLLKLGVAKEMARMCLPVSVFTEFLNTGSFEYFRHFIELRMSPDAQREIAVYAIAMYDIMQPLFPHSLAKLAEQKKFMEELINAGS